MGAHRAARTRPDRGPCGDGTASAEALLRITKPAWLAGVAWRDETEAVMWRADETLLPGPPVGSAVLAEDPQLSDEW
ncbi:hypothetical protein [Streptomyces sp. NPDC056701]|uniref:hypothetical protein n=1 Tax=unclassified Streptomyces TaxID=2593676 RepID=UPI003699DF81